MATLSENTKNMNKTETAPQVVSPDTSIQTEPKTNHPVKALTPRPYQQECIDLINSNPEGRYLISLATGLGKTVIFSHIKRRGRTLILSHRDELVRQPEKYFDCSFGVEKADEHAGDAEVVSASVQTLCHDSRLHAYKPDDFYTIIIDEAHHAAAPIYKKIVGYFTGAKQIIGLTATPKRGDNVRLDDIFDRILYEKDLKWGITHNYLSNLRAVRVTANYKLSGVKKTAGDFNQGDLDSVMNDERVMATAAKAYMQYCHTQGKQTLIYCVSVQMCSVLKAVIDSLLPDKEKDTVQIVTGTTSADERAEILDDFMHRKVRCIINCMVLTEGTDLPIADAIICLRPTQNLSLYQQIVGRGTRLYDGKQYCLLIDIIPTDEKKAKMLCTAPTLFGVDAKFLTDKEKAEIDENHDLMDLCDEFCGVSADYIKHLELKSESYMVFIDSLKAVLKAAQGGALSQLASAYSDFMNEYGSEEGAADFGDLAVSYTPDESKYYCIRPNFNDAVYISKPDMMGNVTVTASISLSFLGIDKTESFQSEMKMEDAIEAARKICYCQPAWTRCMWSSSAKELWKRDKCTQKQAGRIKRTYASSGIRVDDVYALSKLEASNLIDLSEKLKAASNNKKEADKEIKEGKKRAAAGIHSADRPEIQEKEQYEDLKKLLPYLETASERIRKEEKQKEQVQHQENAAYKRDWDKWVKEKKITLDLGSAIVYGTRHNVSVKQAEFIRSLCAKCQSKGVRPYTKAISIGSLSGREGGAFIEFLMEINKRAAYAPECWMDMGDVIESVRRTPLQNSIVCRVKIAKVRK